MKYKQKKYFIYVIVLMALVSVTIGYAYLTSRLSINGETGIAANTWNVGFDNIVFRGCNVETDKPAVITDGNTQEIKFNVTFNDANDTYDFLVDLVNDGSIDAMVESYILEGIDNEDDNLDYHIAYLDGTPIRKCDSLFAGKRRTIRLSFKVKKDDNYTVVDSKTYALTLKVNYVQLDDKECEIPEYEENTNFPLEIYENEGESCDINYGNYHTLTIDPNGGTYENSSEPVLVKLLENQTYKLATPILEGNRNHWIVEEGHEEQYNARTKIVRMLNEDFTITANWFDYTNYVARIGDDYYETIQDAFDAARINDVVVLLKNTNENPTFKYRGGSVIFDMAGFTVSGTLTINNGTNLTLVNSEAGTTAGFQNLDGVAVINNGTFTLGANDGWVLIDDAEANERTYNELTQEQKDAIEYPGVIALIGNNVNGGAGLKNSGTFNFYDGYLEGYVGLSGIFNGSPENYYVFVDHNGERNCQKVYLILRPDRAIAKSTFPGGQVMFYYDLQDGLNSSMDSHKFAEDNKDTNPELIAVMGEGLTIEIIRDDIETPYELNVLEGMTAVVDLAGFKVNTGNRIINNGTFEIDNSVPTKGGLEISDSITNNGLLKLDQMKITQSTDADVIDNYGSLDISKSTIRATAGYSIKINSGTRLDMDSDTLLAANKHALYNGSNQKFSIKGGTIEGIYNAGNLVIEEGTTLKKLTSDDMTYGVFNANSSSVLTLDKVEFKVTGNEKYTYAVYNNDSRAKVIIDGADVEVTSRRSGGSLESSEGATVVYGGVVEVLNDAKLVANNPNGTARIVYGANSVTVNGGEWTANGANTTIFSACNVTINAGEISSLGTNNKYISYNYGTSDKTITVNGTANINTEGSCFYVRTGTVNINSGEITCGGDFVYGSAYSNQYFNNHHNFGTVNINGATINAGGYGVYGTGTVNLGGGTLNTNNTSIYFTDELTSGFDMTNGSIISSNGDGIYSGNGNNHFTFGTNEYEPEDELYIEGKNNGVYMAGGRVTIKNGEIIGHEGYGVYTNGNSVIGVDDRSVSILDPMLKGATYGLYIEEGNYSFEVYDGIFKGETHGYHGVITAVADGYQLKEDGEEVVSEDLTLSTCYLVGQDSFLKLQSTGARYNSLQDAIDAVSETDTIIVLKDHPVRSSSTIPNNKNITLDFDGKKLSFTQTLTNNGTLTLTDNSTNHDGGIESLVTRPVSNKGTMIIEKGNYSTSYELFLDNYGTATMNDGAINVNTSSNYSYAIFNENDSHFTMNNGTINISGTSNVAYGIYNKSAYYHPITVEINDGLIEVTGSGTYIHAIASETAQSNVTINDVMINVTSTYSGRTDYASTYGANGIYGGTVTFENGTMTVNNSVGTARGIVESNFTLNNGTITSNAKYALGMHNTNYTMNHGTLIANGTEDSVAKYDYSDRSAVINNDSVIRSNAVCFEPTSSSSVTVNDGAITCGKSFAYGIGYYNNLGTININGGVITADDYGIYGRGNVNMTAGNMTSSNIGIYLVNEGANVKIYGGNIVSLSGNGIQTDDAKDKVSVGVSDNNYETTTVNITGYQSGIYAPKGIVNVNEANIVGETQYGVYVGGTANFGIDEEISDVSVLKPMVRGFVNGLFIQKGATANIYDGIYKGIDAATVGFISGFPDAYTFVIGMENIDGDVYETKYLTEQAYFLRVNDKENGPEFNSLQQAIDSISESDTIYVIADSVIKTEAEVPLGKDIVLDFNGHTLLSSKSITNNGILTLEDESGSGGISTSELNPLSKFVINNNKLIINGGNYMGLSGIVMYNTREMEINGGYISNTSTTNETYGIRMDGTSDTVPSLKITGGTIEVNSTANYAYGIYTSNYQKSVYPYDTLVPEVEIANATINVSADFAASYFNYWSEDGANAIRGGNVTITNSEVTASNPSQFAKIFMNCNQLTINGGEYNVEAPYAIAVDDSHLTMTDGTINANGVTIGYDIYNHYGYNTHISGESVLNATHNCHVMDGGTTTIDGGTFNCTDYGFTGGFGTFNFNNGIVNVTNNFAFSGSGTLNIRDGEITSKDTAINLTNTSNVSITGGNINSTNGYGLYSTHSGNNIHIGKESEYETTHLPYIYGSKNGVQISAGTLTLGTKDNNVELSSFTIQGGAYGLNNTAEATVKFYDGILKGTEDGRVGTINEIEEGTDIIEPADTETIEEEVDGETTEVTYKLRYLIKTIDIVLNENTGVKYKSLQTAIDEASNDDILDLITNVQLFYPVIVPEGKDVTLDYKGYEIVTTKTITNRGTFNIIDTADNHGHHDTSLRISLYDNYGELNVSDITLNNLLSNEVRPIINEVGGTLNLEDVTINSVNNVYNKGVFTSNNSIFNSTNTAITDEGIISITGGEINASSRGIYSTTNGNGEINGVAITSEGNPIYKYSGSSTLLVKNSNMLVGQIYNRSGILKFEKGSINNKIINSATLIADRTTITDETHDSAPGWSSYTSIENSGTLELDNVTYTLTTYNNGTIRMINNSGTFKSDNSTYDVNKTNDYRWCPTQYYQGNSCGGDYASLIYNTGTVNTKDSTYYFKLTDSKGSHQTNMYTIEHRGGTLTTDGDKFYTEGGLLSYGIYSVSRTTNNSLKDTTFNISTKAKTQYGAYIENGEFTAENTKFVSRDATNAWGVYVSTGSFAFTSGGGVDVLAKTAYGLYIDTATATGIVGIKDGDGTQSDKIKIDYPEIKAIGTVTGIGVRKVNGHFNFYDGRLIGNTHAKPDTTSASEQYYEATTYYDEENDYTFCILEYMRGQSYNQNNKVATINGIFYDSLDLAFRKAKNGEIIKLAKAEVQEDAVNNNTVDVTLDLEGFTLGGTLTNNGYLTITNGQINGGDNNALINTNVVRLGNNDENIVYDDVMLISEGTAVTNTGMIYMYDGYMKGTKALEGRNVIEPYYGEVVRENIEETVEEETKVYDTLYLTEYTGEKISEIDNKFDYTGEESTYVAPADGYYQLEVWGASGGSSLCDGEICGTPGYGAYSTGVVYLHEGDKLYINVGGQGGNGSLTSCSTGGYNGGGKGTNDGGGCTSAYDNEAAGGGGGATHIALKSGILSALKNSREQILIVAGGGGGAAWNFVSGSGGGYIGGFTDNTRQDAPNQRTGAYFGKGANGSGVAQTNSTACNNSNPNSTSCDGVAGGGGGWYGGAAIDNDVTPGATGGSGYIGNTQLVSITGYDKVMYGYKVSESTSVDTKTISTTEVSENPEANTAKIGNGYAKVTQLLSYKSVQEGKVTKFDYTGAEETFVAPEDGYYLLETWGASGGAGGYGGYSVGAVYLIAGSKLYINVGGAGTLIRQNNYRNPGGYNGGGDGGAGGGGYPSSGGGSGGGATHIALKSGLLSTLENSKDDIIIVSGGGGGSGSSTSGGSGGGFMGADSGTYQSYQIASGATQETGYAFGQGASGRDGNYNQYASGGSGGGGGGYYGGFAIQNTDYYSQTGAGGGSGYIGSNSLLSVFGYEKIMYGYNVTESDEVSTKTISTDEYSNDAESGKAKAGDGHARITQLIISKETEREETYQYGYTGSESTFTVPKDGYYLLETWGASGGADEGYAAGYGAYSRGAIYLTRGTQLYINVGGQGFRYDGGYNGGGAGGHGTLQWGYGGGGATHIALSSGLLSTFEDSQNDLLIVAGGGGGNGGSEPNATGGVGGGAIGQNGFDVDASSSGVSYYGKGATQENGGYSVNLGRSYAKGTFGQGSDYYNDNYGGAGGGGGYYGGGGSTRGFAGAGGGSGYIGNSKLINYESFNKVMYAYRVEEVSDESSLTLTTYDYSETPISEKAKAGDGYAKITFINSGEINIERTYEFDYIGQEEVFVAPENGYYKLETWGAQGGGIAEIYNGGYGGYSVGEVLLEKGTKLYVNVGGSGSSVYEDYTTCDVEQFNTALGGYNGGGLSNSTGGGFSGGGATHIARVSGTLASLNNYIGTYDEDIGTYDSDYLLIVAGGGGGANTIRNVSEGRYHAGGSGGGYKGFTAYSDYGGGTQNGSYNNNIGSNQNGVSNEIGTFGQGGAGVGAKCGGAGGGGGFYGGSGSFDTQAAGGGSGYIGSSLLYNKKMVMYATDPKYISDEESTKTEITTKYSYDAISDYAKSGNGYARITLVSKDSMAVGTELNYDYDANKDYYEFVVPKSGYYKLEAWGASGGLSKNYNQPDGDVVGKGAYTSGITYLEQDQVIYIYVGGEGESAKNYYTLAKGGYNGGGDGSLSTDNDDSSGAGGGATDFRYFGDNYTPSTDDLLWNSLIGLNSRVMVAGGGGGAHITNTTSYTEGMNAGGLAVSGDLSTWTGSWTPTVNQTTGGNFGYGSDGTISSHAGAGGGGGYYGGYSQKVGEYAGRAAGGSSYISGHLGTVSIVSSSDSGAKNGCTTGNDDYECSYHYSSIVFNQTTMIDGAGYSWTNTRSSEVPMPIFDGAVIDGGNVGNGHARITYIKEYEDIDVYYANGNIYKPIYHTNSWTSEKPSYGSSYLSFPSGNFYVFYSDLVDLSNYNSIIMKKTGWVSGRNGFDQYPMRVNQEGEFLVPNWITMNNDVYIGDISDKTRTDLHIFISQYGGSNAGNVYFIALSTKTIDELQLEGLDFIEDY